MNTEQPWKLKDGRTIYLIKETDLRDIPKGTILHDIFGERAEVGKDDIDLDTRGGYLAYGILSEDGRLAEPGIAPPR